MKQAIRCIGCDTVTRINETYKVNVKEIATNPHTGEKKEQEFQWRVCRNCAKSAGYKVRKNATNKK